MTSAILPELRNYKTLRDATPCTSLLAVEIAALVSEPLRACLEASCSIEGTSVNAGYFDFGSFEEFQVGGAGTDSSGFAGGAMLSISVKSGGDRFAGTWYSDYVSESQLTDNVPDYLRQANTRADDGTFSRLPTGLCFQRSGETVCRDNAVQKQYDLNATSAARSSSRRPGSSPAGA